jgi:hypothetical protein
MENTQARARCGLQSQNRHLPSEREHCCIWAGLAVSQPIRVNSQDSRSDR